MDQDPLALHVPPGERIAAIARFLPHLANTAQYGWLLEIAQTFFHFDADYIDESSVARLVRRADEQMAKPGWEDAVLSKSGVERIFLTNDFDDPLEGFDTTRYVPCLRTDDLVFRLDDLQTADRLRRATQVDVRDVRSLSAAIATLFQHFVNRGALACAISLPPDFEATFVSPADVDSHLREMFSGQPIATQAKQRVQRFVFWTLASYCAQFRLPFDLMIGVHRRVYRGGVFQGQDLFDQRTSLYGYRELFNEFPKVTFPISVLTSNQNQELVSYAWIFPNVVPHGHWWYSNLPVYIESDARARLTAVPLSKQIGYYSDAYKLEFILPKFNMYRRVLARILAQDFVLGRRWSETQAVELARRTLRGNVQRIFRLEED
jgi:glucuronate isomerase